MTAVTVQGLTWSYQRQPILHNISLTIPAASFATILGRNGSGKSTLLRCLSGLLPLPTGTVWIDGQDLSQITVAARAQLLGYLPQFHAPIFPFLVRDVVVTGRASRIFLTPSRQDYQKSLEALELLNILHLEARPYTDLSGGERQLVMIARIVAQSPKIILLDEPLAHLDLCNQIRLLQLLQLLTQQGKTIIAVLHDPTLALRFGQYHLFLKDGAIASMPPNPDEYDAFLSTIYDTSLRTLSFEGNILVLPA